MPALLAGPLLIAAMVLLLFTLPITLPIVALLHKRDQGRLRVAACGMRCVRCDHLLGIASLDASDAAERERMAELHRLYPFHKLRIVRRSHARCVNCGTDYAWDERRRVLELAPAEPPSE